jgi:hypothetical protein
MAAVFVGAPRDVKNFDFDLDISRSDPHPFLNVRRTPYANVPVFESPAYLASEGRGE